MHDSTACRAFHTGDDCAFPLNVPPMAAPRFLRSTSVATCLLALASCSHTPLSGPDPLGPDHVPAMARGLSPEAHQDRKFHYDHYREAQEGGTSTRRSIGATSSVTW